MQKITKSILSVLTAATVIPVGVGAITASTAGADSSYTLNRTLQDSRITESSGLARSTYHNGVLYTHNDSGGDARIFAVDANGRTLGSVKLTGAKTKDWEDIDSGPGHRLWIGDIGDNRTRRPSITVYTVAEPSKPVEGSTTPATAYTLRYSDGSHNSEAIMVHPTTGRLYVVTKTRTGHGAIYRAPETLSTTKTNVLTKMAAVPRNITGGGWAPDGKSFALTNYSTVYVYRSIGGAPVQLDNPPLKQGESLVYGSGSGSILLGSEGARSPVYTISNPLAATTAP